MFWLSSDKPNKIRYWITVTEFTKFLCDWPILNSCHWMTIWNINVLLKQLILYETIKNSKFASAIVAWQVWRFSRSLYPANTCSTTTPEDDVCPLMLRNLHIQMYVSNTGTVLCGKTVRSSLYLWVCVHRCCVATGLVVCPWNSEHSTIPFLVEKAGWLDGYHCFRHV